MGYYTHIMIEAKARYGHILRDRNLVMRGKRDGDSLTLVFKRKGPGDWKLPVELHVPGKSETGRDQALWEDVQLTADIHQEVTFGDAGWVGFICRQSERLEYLHGDDMSKFIEQIGLYIKECSVIPYGEVENRVSPETAMAYADLIDLIGAEDPGIQFSTDGNLQTLTVEDAAGQQSVSFAWNEKKVAGEIYVDGKLAERLERPESWEIQDALSRHFTSQMDLKIR
ncbi:hypothetical protein [Mesorhizobium sp. KR1-2]|uniref:hypothetical protein n=1 Tax=Mesorhizobium sp. KR1-2 TaxID=3156609 RepID=UPI0032B5CE1E